MSHEERLLAYLFQAYDPVARAVMDTSKPVVVSVDFVLLRIHGLVSSASFFHFIIYRPTDKNMGFIILHMSSTYEFFK